jgi:hypothetical protein
VTRYDLGFYRQGAASPFQVASLGKPVPQSDGQIRINLSTLTLPAGTVYEARVIAVGPGGEHAERGLEHVHVRCGVQLRGDTDVPHDRGWRRDCARLGDDDLWVCVDDGERSDVAHRKQRS